MPESARDIIESRRARSARAASRWRPGGARSTARSSGLPRHAAMRARATGRDSPSGGCGAPTRGSACRHAPGVVPCELLLREAPGKRVVADACELLGGGPAIVEPDRIDRACSAATSGPPARADRRASRSRRARAACADRREGGAAGARLRPAAATSSAACSPRLSPRLTSPRRAPSGRGSRRDRDRPRAAGTRTRGRAARDGRSRSARSCRPACGSRAREARLHV